MHTLEKILLTSAAWITLGAGLVGGACRRDYNITPEPIPIVAPAPTQEPIPTYTSVPPTATSTPTPAPSPTQKPIPTIAQETLETKIMPYGQNSN